MTDESTSTNDTSTSQGTDGAAPPVRRTRARRVATSGVTNPSAAATGQPATTGGTDGLQAAAASAEQASPASTDATSVAPPTSQAQGAEPGAPAADDAPAPRARARRATRASRAASAQDAGTGTAESAATTSTDGGGSGRPAAEATAPSAAAGQPGGSAPDGAGAATQVPDAPPTRARRSRRATSAPAAEPAPALAAAGDVASAGVAVTPPASTDLPPADAPADAPAAKAPRRRRATSAAAAPEPATATDQAAPRPEADTAAPSRAADAAAQDTDAAGPAAAPAAGEEPGRDAAASGASAPEGADEEVTDGSAPSEPGAAGAGAAGLDVLAELGPMRVDPQPARTVNTALLFQAPDPSGRPRRRRAQAPAGPPRVEEPVEDGAPVAGAGPADGEPIDPTAQAQSAVEQPDGDETAQVTETAQDTGTAQDAETAQDAGDTQDTADTGDDEDGPRRRRRRGGRGRRSRSTGDGEDGAGEATDEAGDEAPESAAEPEPDAEETPAPSRRSRRRGGSAGPVAQAPADADTETSADEDEDSDSDSDSDEEGEDSTAEGSSSSRRRRRRRRGSRTEPGAAEEPAAATAARVRSRAGRTGGDEVTALRGSTRLEAKRQRRRDGRDSGRRRTIVTESEFLARRESVERSMVVREANGRVQIAVLEDGVLVEHFVSRSDGAGQNGPNMAGNVYLGRVQNVLPSMEAAFVDVGKGRNAVLYAGEVNWDAAGLEGQPRRIEQALKSGDSVLVQVTKDPIGHKGARLTSQVTLAGRYLVYVPGGGMTGISRKLPENERARLKKILKEIVPDAAGVIVRTAAEGASDEELRRDVQRLQDQWAAIEKKAKTASAPALLQGEPDLAIRVVRDIFNDDFSRMVVQGDEAWTQISEYVRAMAPDLEPRVSRWSEEGDVFAAHRVDEQLAKGMDRKVWLPSGGSLVIDRTEAMTVVDVNTGKFTGSGGTLEETVTRNNLEAAEEIVRQLRLRDIGGIIVIDFIDMVLESNRDLVLRRLVECLGRDRTKHQVAEVTSLGLVQMTRKRVGQGLVEAFSETCQHCNGRGFIVHSEPVEGNGGEPEERSGPHGDEQGDSKRSRRKKPAASAPAITVPVLPEARAAVKATLATIAAAAAHAHTHGEPALPEPELSDVRADPMEIHHLGTEQPEVDGMNQDGDGRETGEGVAGGRETDGRGADGQVAGGQAPDGQAPDGQAPGGEASDGEASDGQRAGVTASEPRPEHAEPAEAELADAVGSIGAVEGGRDSDISEDRPQGPAGAVPDRL